MPFGTYFFFNHRKEDPDEWISSDPSHAWHFKTDITMNNYNCKCNRTIICNLQSKKYNDPQNIGHIYIFKLLRWQICVWNKHIFILNIAIKNQKSALANRIQTEKYNSNFASTCEWKVWSNLANCFAYKPFIHFPVW